MATLTINGTKAIGIPASEINGDLRNIAICLGWKSSKGWYYNFDLSANADILSAGKSKLLNIVASASSEDLPIIKESLSSALCAHKSIVLNKISESTCEEVRKALDSCVSFLKA